MLFYDKSLPELLQDEEQHRGCLIQTVWLDIRDSFTPVNNDFQEM